MSGFNIKNITNLEAFELLKNDQDAELIDIRTKEEWQNYGVADLSEINKQVFLINMHNFPAMEPNNDFEKIIKEKFSEKKKLLFICKSGGRSLNAVVIAQALGFENSYNVLGGMESESNGWKSSGLAWRKF